MGVNAIKFKAILFDLDGTLLDTLEDLADTTNAALEQMGFEKREVEAYRYFLGEGYRELVERALPEDGRDEETIADCIELARQKYSQHWADKTMPYPGVAEMLDKLRSMGVVMGVLSNKVDDFTEKTVRHFLGDYEFKVVRGAVEGVPLKPDPTAALQIAQQMDIEPADFVFLGDSNVDMETANAAGMYAVGALWGFRTAEELKQAGAKVIVERPEEVCRFFEGD
jgi:phosphoglycolate phosphatase